MHQLPETKRIVVIGGGITGLAAAHRLIEHASQINHELQVLLLEAGSRLGGVIKTHQHNGFLIEGGPDSFISEKPEVIELANRIGLASHLIETNPAHRRSFIVRNGWLRPVPEGFQLLAPSRLWPFVTSDIFSWAGKARMALDLLLPRRGMANGIEEESLAQFVRRRLGREALERMAQPMVGGIYTADPEKLSLRATMPRFLEMEREHGSLIRAMWKRVPGGTPTVREGVRNIAVPPGTSGARYSLFLSFDQGMQMLVDKLASIFPRSSIRLNTTVQYVAFDPSSRSWRIKTSDDESINAETVCLAVPSYVAARLVREADSELASELDAIPYASTATINLAYRREDVPHPLDGFGFVVPFIERRTILACTFSSVKFAGRAPEDHALLRAFVGGALQPEVFELDEEEMVQRVRDDLRDLLGIEKPPLFTPVERWRNSMPQYHVGHIERVERIEQRLASLPGLVLTGNAYTGAGIPDCIRSGETAAEEILNRFADR